MMYPRVEGLRPDLPTSVPGLCTGMSKDNAQLAFQQREISVLWQIGITHISLLILKRFSLISEHL